MPKAKPDVRKQVWKFQEGAVVLALLASGIKRKNVSWHQGKTPTGMSIEPDVIVEQKGRPVLVVFVTHASAERAGEKKFWRGVAEVVEAKRLPSHPRIVNVVFSGETKENLSLLNERLYDGCVHLKNAGYGRELTDTLHSLAEEHGASSANDCLEILENAVKRKIVRGFNAFKRDIAQAVVGPLGQFHKNLCSSAFSSKARTTIAQRTSYRRGLIKLFTLPSETREALYSRKTAKNVPEHALALGWFVKTIAGALLDDEDISWVLRFVTLDEANRVHRHADKMLPAFVQYSQTLNEIGVLWLANKWIIENYGSLATAHGMWKALDQVFKSPRKALEPLGLRGQRVGNHWLLASIISMLRTETGRADGYGYSKLGQEAGRRKELNAFAGTIMAPYLQLRADIDVGLRKDIATVLAGHLNRLGEGRCAALLVESVDTTLKSVFNYQLSGYRHFNPIEWELIRLLADQKRQFDWPASHKSFLANESSGISSSTGNLISVANGRAFIKCQSAYDGRIDKRKELCGRVGAMKLAYTARQLKNLRFFLVADGYFDQKDIDLLLTAGWDGVYYPNQCDVLIADLAKFLDS